MNAQNYKEALQRGSTSAGTKTEEFLSDSKLNIVHVLEALNSDIFSVTATQVCQATFKQIASWYPSEIIEVAYTLIVGELRHAWQVHLLEKLLSLVLCLPEHNTEIEGRWFTKTGAQAFDWLLWKLLLRNDFSKEIFCHLGEMFCGLDFEFLGPQYHRLETIIKRISISFENEPDLISKFLQFGERTKTQNTVMDLILEKELNEACILEVVEVIRHIDVYRNRLLWNISREKLFEDVPSRTIILILASSGSVQHREKFADTLVRLISSSSLKHLEQVIKSLSIHVETSIRCLMLVADRVESHAIYSLLCAYHPDAKIAILHHLQEQLEKDSNFFLLIKQLFTPEFLSDHLKIDTNMVPLGLLAGLPGERCMDAILRAVHCEDSYEQAVDPLLASLDGPFKQITEQCILRIIQHGMFPTRCKQFLLFRIAYLSVRELREPLLRIWNEMVRSAQYNPNKLIDFAPEIASTLLALDSGPNFEATLQILSENMPSGSLSQVCVEFMGKSRQKNWKFISNLVKRSSSKAFFVNVGALAMLMESIFENGMHFSMLGSIEYCIDLIASCQRRINEQCLESLILLMLRHKDDPRIVDLISRASKITNISLTLARELISINDASVQIAAVPFLEPRLLRPHLFGDVRLCKFALKHLKHPEFHLELLSEISVAFEQINGAKELTTVPNSSVILAGLLDWLNSYDGLSIEDLLYKGTALVMLSRFVLLGPQAVKLQKLFIRFFKQLTKFVQSIPSVTEDVHRLLDLALGELIPNINILSVTLTKREQESWREVSQLQKIKKAKTEGKKNTSSKAVLSHQRMKGQPALTFAIDVFLDEVRRTSERLQEPILLRFLQDLNLSTADFKIDGHQLALYLETYNHESSSED